MECSYRIINGRIIDPAANFDGLGDIYISGDKMARTPERPEETVNTIDASGCLVVPGLIDFHTHIYRDHSDFGIHPDLMTLPNGITSVVDAGSAGVSNFVGFYRDVVSRAEITVKSYLNISGPGQITRCFGEDTNPAFYATSRIEQLFARYPEQLLGLKVRVGDNVSKPLGLTPLAEACKLARQIGTRVCAHVTQPPSSYGDIFPLLGPGDVLCHCFQNNEKNYTILDSDGKVDSPAREARERGVVFDIAHGQANHSLHIARKALADAFLPDVISSDSVAFSLYGAKVFNLPYVMTAYLGLGAPLMEILRAVTATPARLMGLAGQIGTLAPSAQADVAIFDLREQPITIKDAYGDSVTSDHRFVLQSCLKAGRMVYANMELAGRD
jgi:dihydroorotase